MGRVIYGSCMVNTGSLDSVYLLDPCNCTTYYKLTSLVVVTKERLSCTSSQLWNHIDEECRQRNFVLKNNLCNERRPWDRCFEISDSDKIKIENKCVRDGFYQPSTGDAFFINNIQHRLLPRESQSANLELVFAAMIAGSVITLMTIALLVTLCDWKYFSNIKLPSFLSREFRRKSRAIVVQPNITEGDNVSVVYEDVEEYEEDALNSGYKAMSTSDIWQSPSSRTSVPAGKQTDSKSYPPIVRPRRPPAPPDSSSKPASLQVEMSVHNMPKLKTTPKNSADYIHPQ